MVEIAGLTEHLLTECESKGKYSKCPRCTEAILKSEFDEHVKAKACNRKFIVYCMSTPCVF